MKTYPMKKRAIVLFLVAPLFSIPMTSIAKSNQVSSGKDCLASSSENQIYNLNLSDLGLEIKEITNQELPRDLSDSIREHMRQPLKLEEKLSERLRNKGMEVHIKGARLMKLVSTTDSPIEVREGVREEVRNFLRDFPLSAYFIGHIIVDKESGQKTGVLISLADESIPPTAVIKHSDKNGMDGLYAMSSHAEKGITVRSKRFWDMDCDDAFAGSGAVIGALICDLHPVTRVPHKVMRMMGVGGCGAVLGIVGNKIGKWVC
ncbi:hypothetical protein [Pasteuria penetrans]|uniref:hypothetical protein n=1 Tax=Pasteuria penetrans TaxID=86005 RepID=UPI000FB36468|nr:hypothetical protein [Pasteuria penetrans]